MSRIIVYPRRNVGTGAALRFVNVRSVCFLKHALVALADLDAACRKLLLIPDRLLTFIRNCTCSSLNAYYTHLKPQAKSKSVSLCDNVEVNKKFAAFPWTTIGGE